MTGIPTDYLNQIVTGDARELAERVPDESVDLIFTDPPYARKHEQVICDLGTYAARVLKNRGSLVTFCGQQQVPRVIEYMHGLQFRWIGWLINERKTRLPGIWIKCGGKPILWFVKGTNIHVNGFWWDTQHAQQWDKTGHEWQQPIDWALWNIEKLSNIGDMVLDPFCGYGTIPLAAKHLNRNYVAFEIDPATAERARARVEMTQAMHPTFLEEQEQMELVA